MPGAGEIILIVMFVAIVFFGEKVGALGDALGRARREFRRGQTDDERIVVKPATPHDEPAGSSTGSAADAKKSEKAAK